MLRRNLHTGEMKAKIGDSLRTFIQLRLGRHEDKQDETFTRTVLDAVFDSSRSQDAPIPPDLALLRADAKPAAALQDDINLVGVLMEVRFLFLSVLETVQVAEKSIRFGQIVLLELVGGEVAAFLKIEDMHSFSYRGSRRPHY